jgi:hypothetical protein
MRTWKVPVMRFAGSLVLWRLEAVGDRLFVGQVVLGYQEMLNNALGAQTVCASNRPDLAFDVGRISIPNEPSQESIYVQAFDPCSDWMLRESLHRKVMRKSVSDLIYEHQVVKAWFVDHSKHVSNTNLRSEVSKGAARLKHLIGDFPLSAHCLCEDDCQTVFDDSGQCNGNRSIEAFVTNLARDFLAGRNLRPTKPRLSFPRSGGELSRFSSSQISMLRECPRWRVFSLGLWRAWLLLLSASA